MPAVFEETLMILAIDTNVLLDILIPYTAHVETFLTKTPFSKPALPGKNTLPVKKVRFCALLVVNNKKLPVLTAMKLFFTASTF